MAPLRGSTAFDRFVARHRQPRSPARIWHDQVAAERNPGPQMTLAEFVRGAWPQIEPSLLAWNWHLALMCEHAEAVERGEIRRLLVNVPPGHSKSLVFTVFWPLWAWTRRPELRWLIISVNEMAAKRDARRARTILTSLWFQSRWGHRVRLAQDERATDDIGTSAGGKRWLRPIGGTITALRGDRVVVDDPQAVKDTLYSPAAREAARESVRGEVLTRVNDEKTTPIVIAQQRIHEHDVSGDLLGIGGWDHLCIPQEFDPETSKSAVAMKDPRAERGEFIQPERLGPKEWADILKTVRAAHAQHNQRPEADGGSRIKKDWLRRWTRPKLPERWDVLATSWDLTMGKARRDTERGEREGRRSFVVGQLWGVRLSSLYLLAQVRGEWEADAQLRIVDEFAATLAPHGGTRESLQYATSTYVEDAALGPTASSLTKAPGLILVPTGGKSKEERLDDVLSIIATGRVFVPDDSEAEWVAGFINRVTRFPSSEPDDEVDAMSMVLAQLANDPAAALREIHGQAA